MAVSKSETQITWPTAVNSKSVAAGGSQESEELTFSATAFKVDIELKADNDGTPAAGDTVTFYLLLTGGDPDGTGSDEFATAEHGIFLAELDTNTEDPAIEVVPGVAAPKKGKIRAVNNSSGRAITVSALAYEYKA